MHTKIKQVGYNLHIRPYRQKTIFQQGKIQFFIYFHHIVTF